MIRLALNCLTCLLVCLAVGCGDSMVKVTGKVTDKGGPVKVGRGQDLSVIFMPASDAGQGPAAYHVANVNNDDGTFEVPGNGGKGIPPGKYRISVAVRAMMGKDVLNKFTTEDSKIVREVSKENSEVLIDISRPEG